MHISFDACLISIKLTCNFETCLKTFYIIGPDPCDRIALPNT
jgi:hypothetical protein